MLMVFDYENLIVIGLLVDLREFLKILDVKEEMRK